MNIRHLSNIQDFLQNRFQILSPMTNEPEPEEEASVNIPEGTPPPSTPRRSCLAAAGPKVAEDGQDFSLGKTSSHATSEGGRSTAVTQCEWPLADFLIVPKHHGHNEDQNK